MKCQSLFSGEKKKKNMIRKLSSAEFAHSMVSVYHISLARITALPC